MSRLRTSVAALRGFNVRVYIAGQALSMVGSFTQSFAQSWLVLGITHNRTSLPFVIGLQTIPLLLFGSWGGSIADRFDNRRLLMVTSVLNVATTLGIAVLVQRGGIGVNTVYAFAFAGGLISAPERPAMQAILSEFARPEEISSAIGLNAMVNPTARLLGPPVASVLISTVGMAACFYVNAASFALVLVSIMLTRRSEMLPRARSRRTKGAVREGLRYARRDPIVGPVLLAMFFVGTAGFNFMMIMPMMAKYTFHIGEGRLAPVLSLSAVGSLVAGAVMAGVARPTTRMLGIAGCAFGVILILNGAAPTYLLWLLVAFPVGVSASLYTTMVMSILQRSSRPDMLGRVMALYSIAWIGTTPIGAVFVAWLSSSVSERAPFIAGGIVVALTGLATLVTLRRARPAAVGAGAA